MSLLIIGGTGTLGRQVVLQALLSGFNVRCVVRNFRKANFLKEWGVELVCGDLTSPKTIPPCLKGITAIIDVSTSRADESDSLKKVDWDGKLCLIEAAKASNIEHFIFFSVQNAEQFENIPLMKLKYGIEQKLKESNIPYTIFRLTAFYQGLIEQYAIPILEDLPILMTNEDSSLPYMDTQDIAKFCLRALQLPQAMNRTFSLSGLESWSSLEIIYYCEQLIGQKARIKRIQVRLLNLLLNFFQFFEWTQGVSDRLLFVNIIKMENNFSTTTFGETSYLYEMFKINSEEIIELDSYLLEYFRRLLKRLQDINFEDVQKQKNLII